MNITLVIPCSMDLYTFWFSTCTSVKKALELDGFLAGWSYQGG